MGRKKRLWHPAYFDHVVVRGNNRQVIFTEKQDFQEFFRAINYVYDQYPFELLAYCLMNNHYHLLIRSRTPLSKTMMMLNRRYLYWPSLRKSLLFRHGVNGTRATRGEPLHPPKSSAYKNSSRKRTRALPIF